MRHRTFRSAAALAVGVLLASAAIVFADTVPADGRGDVVGVQRSVDLGQAAPGQVVTWPVAFQLTCGGTTHATPGDVINLDPGARSAAFGGAISATSTTIGPVPADWPSGGVCSDPLQTLDANAPSIVTLTMPRTLGNRLQFSMSWTRTGATGLPTPGLSGSTSMLFVVDVVNTPPRLNLPTDLTLEAVGPAGAPASYTATATDAEDAIAPTPTCRPASGSTFALGTTTVNCSATDSGGLTTSGSFHVTVRDTTAPSLVLPADQTAEATSPAGASVSFTTSASDIVDGSVSVSCDHASGDTFALGTTTVSCSATDSAGNSTSGSFHVTVRDTISPSLVLPADQSAEATSPAGASVSFTTSANDIVDGSISVSCDHGSGDTFALGTTTVSCSATDTAGNAASGFFLVTVRDATAPVLALPADQSAEATSPAGASVSFTASANDIVDGPVSVTCDHASGDTFALGTTTVNCSATDSAGNSTSGSFGVSVVDTTAPTLTGMPSDMTLTTGNPAGATLTYTAPGATDAADPAPTVGCLPATGSSIPVGTTTITCTATDAAGLHSSASFTARVTYVSPIPPTTWTSVWGEPVASPGDTFVANSGRTIPFKLAILANGVAQTSGRAAVSVVACAGGTPLSIALGWDGGRWAGHLDTSALAGPGCYVVTVWLDGNAAGSFRLDLRGADPAPGATPKATPAPKAKSKP